MSLNLVLVLYDLKSRELRLDYGRILLYILLIKVYEKCDILIISNFYVWMRKSFSEHESIGNHSC